MSYAPSLEINYLSKYILYSNYSNLSKPIGSVQRLLLVIFLLVHESYQITYRSGSFTRFIKSLATFSSASFTTKLLGTNKQLSNTFSTQLSGPSRNYTFKVTTHSTQLHIKSNYTFNETHSLLKFWSSN